MNSRLALLFALVAACATAACASTSATVRTRAAFDLKCPAEQLTITELTDVCGPFLCTVGVSGCGQQATYVMDKATSSWVMNNATTGGAAPSATPAAPTSATAH
jgi:hypothetical protein